jgi:glucose/arabinose dehydrogenase
VVTIAQGLNMPNGVAFRDGALYVAEVNRPLRYDRIESNLKNPPQPIVITDRFPKTGIMGGSSYALDLTGCFMFPWVPRAMFASEAIHAMPPSRE